VSEDHKLFSLALAVWVGAAGKGLFGTLWFIALIPILLSWRRVGALLLISILVGTTNFTIHQIALSHNALHRLAGEEIRFLATVQSDPKVGQAKVIGSFRRPAATSFIARASTINGNRIRVPVRISTRTHFTSPPGTTIAGTATVVATRERTTSVLLVVHGEIERVARPDDCRDSIELSKRGRAIFR
jgi:hypothetical protein